MKYTVNLRVETYSGIAVEPYTVSAGNPKSAGSIAAAKAMDKHGRDNVTEVLVVSVEEAKTNAA